MKEGWTYKRFDEIMTPAKVERCGNREDLPILSITMHGGIVEQNDRFKKTIASVDKTNYKVVKDGQLVIAFPIDEGLLYTQDVANEGIMSPAYNIWDVDYSLIDRRFLVTYFHSAFAFAYYRAKLRGSTQRRRSMDKDDLLSMPIPVPSLIVQKGIVEELDSLKDVIVKQKAQLEELNNLAQSTFYDMFGDPVINEKGWSISKYGDEFKIGSGGTPSKSNPEYWEGGDIPWIGSNMCQNCVVYDNDGKYITEKGLRGSSANILKVGTVLIALVGATIGKVALLQKEMATNQNIANINVWDNNNFEPIFIFYHSMNLYHLFIKLGDGGFKMANQSFIRELPLILPPLALQQEFAAKIEAIEQMKAKVRQSLKESEELFNSRMDYYFN